MKKTINYRKQAAKISRGQFFTKSSCWLYTQIVDFIRLSGRSTAYDPFVGKGDLLKQSLNSRCGLSKVIGLDIDQSFGWKTNDSLKSIPHEDDSIIITNPPYLSNYSATRKGVMSSVDEYFKQTKYDDLYLLALDKMIESNDFIVAIIPETFINSCFKDKDLLNSITVLEDNPFTDTFVPVCIACFDGKRKPFDQIKIYKNEDPVCSLADVESSRLSPENSVQMKFNDPSGWLAIRCVDSTDPMNMIHFDFAENIKYDFSKRIKDSSRLLTLVSLDVDESKRAALIQECNCLLAEFRAKSHDIALSPFKGNMKNGQRRRRVDFKTCRAIIENACKSL